jgi:hypothetical protein
MIICVMKDESEIEVNPEKWHLHSSDNGMHLALYDYNGDLKLIGPLKAAYHKVMKPVTTAIFPGQTWEDFYEEG